MVHLIGHVDGLSRRAVTGWAADLDEPDREIDVSILLQGVALGHASANLPRTDLAKMPAYGAGRHGFVWNFAAALPTDQDLQVEIQFRDTGQPLQQGRQHLTAQEYRATKRLFSPEARLALTPLLLTASGRSGTTLLMQLLAKNPAIVLGASYPYELKIATYYANTLNILSSRADHEHSAHPDRLHQTHWMGANPFNHPNYENVFNDVEAVHYYFSNIVQNNYKMVTKDLIATFYSAMARDQGKYDARFFAEKCDPVEKTRANLRAIYPDLREIVLVRDLRDVYCSARSFWSVDGQFIASLAGTGRALIDIVRSSNPVLVRYEDLIANEAATLDALYRQLGIPLPDGAVPTTNPDPIFSQHGTSESAASSVGRWDNELSSAEKDHLTARCQDFLTAFGYQ